MQKFDNRPVLGGRTYERHSFSTFQKLMEQFFSKCPKTIPVATENSGDNINGYYQLN
ncbi:hypothetical protein FQZ97_1237180 [compost metagenome]